MIQYQWTRRQVLARFDCQEFAYIRAADELGLFPDPILETAKLRATITHMLASGGRSVLLADFLPDVLVPPPDPEDDARKMALFTARMANVLGTNRIR